MPGAGTSLGEITRFEGHTGEVICVAFSPDGKRALTGSSDNTVHLWDVASGATIQTLTGHTQMVWSVAFSPEGKRGVSAAYDGTVRVWDLDRGQEMQNFRGHANPVRRAVFLPNGKQVLSAGWDRQVRLWNSEDGREIRTYSGNKSNIYWMALSPDAARVVSTGGDKDLHCWDVASGQEREPYQGETGDVYAIAYSRDGQLLAASGGDRMVRIWRTSQPAALLHVLPGHEGPVNAVAFTPDGRWLLSASDDQTVRVWDVQAGKERGRFYGPDGCKMLSVALAASGRTLLTGGSDHMARLWRLPPNTLVSKPDDPAGEVKRFTGHTGEINSVVFSPDDRLALSGGNDGIVRLWDTGLDRELRQFLGHQDNILSVAFSPDGRLILSGSKDRTARVWETATGRERVCFRDHTNWVRSVAFSPDGKQALSASGGPDNGDCTLRLWDLANGREIHVLRGHEQPVTCAVFTPDGRHAVSASDDRTVRLWDLVEGRELRKYQGHTSNVYSVAVSADGRLAASASFDKTVRLWDLQGDRELLRLEGHTDLVMSVAFSPDGRRLLSGSLDRTVRLWDLENGRELAVFRGDQGPVSSVAFSHDGRYALSGGDDKEVRLWRMPFMPFVVGRPLAIKPGVLSAENKPSNPRASPSSGNKLPVPEEESLKKEAEDIHNTYKADLASRKAEDWAALAAKLLKRGMNGREEPSRRFAYFSEARDLAARGGEVELSLHAIDEMANVFAVEPLPMKVAALELALKGLRTVDTGKKLLVQALTAAEEAESADEYEQAGKLLKIAQSAAGRSRDVSLANVVAQRQSRLKRLQEKYTKIADAVHMRTERPDDAPANLTVGKFQCFDKDDWKKGLPMLARGSDERLAELARQDEEKPNEAKAQAELGNQWWDFAEKQMDAVTRAAGRHRAQHWYLLALPSLASEEKARVEARLERKFGTVRFRPGLLREVFDGENLEKRVKTRLDYKLDHDWGEGSPEEKAPADHFSVRWQGWLIPPRAGKYNFSLFADDGARLIVDGQTILDCWGTTPVTTHTKEIELTSKPHLFQLEYREWVGAAVIRLHWSLEAGFSEQPIALDALHHDTKQERFLAP